MPLLRTSAVVLLLLLQFAFASQAAQSPPDFRFKAESLAAGLRQPMELEVAPDGRIFINELNGKLLIYNPISRKILEAGEIPVFNAQEGGFLGFALDPQFARNQFIYLFYSPKDFKGQRLSRFQIDGDQLVLASEKKILEFPEQREDCCHHAGSVEFGPNGDLFISTGDNTHPGGDSEGYAPIDERPGRGPFDAQKSSANTHDLRGKILRIRLTPQGGYTIPDGNLFPKDGSQGRPEIFVMGCRNPWRMSVDQRTGIIYWGDVGPDAGGDGKRGSRGYDEINQARQAGNYGWPYFIGNNFPYADYDYATKTPGPLFDPARPVNEGPNNTGSRVLPPAQPALIYWPYGESKEFPMLGSGGRTACAGPVFHFKPEFKNSGGFPEFFDRCLLFYDWQRPFIKWARLDSDSRLVGIEPFTAAVTVVNDRDRANAARARGEFVIQRPVDSQFGADGCLYLLDYGETWGPNNDAQLVKISYLWGNVPPIARISATPSAGREPLEVSLSSAGSLDYEGDPISHEWRLHPSGKLLSREPNPRVTLEQPGNYVVELKVSDAKGAAAAANLPLVVGNSYPEVRFQEPHEGDFFTHGKPVSYKVFVTDREDGNSQQLDEIFEPRVFVSARWGRGDGKAEADAPGLAAMKQSDCFNCHSLQQRIVGPSFLEIADKYRKDSAAFEATVQRVIKGSAGLWGEAPMLPHESLHPDQVRMMVRWIYDLEADKLSANVNRGLSGQAVAPADPQLREAVLEASYTDAGRANAAPLTSRAHVKLRSRTLEAEFADEKKGLRVLGNFLGAIDHGHHAMWKAVNLESSSSAVFRVASAGSGGTIELRAGSPGGPLLTQVKVDPTGGWDKWVELQAPLTGPKTRADLFVVFVNPGKGGLMNLDSVHFHE